MRILAFQYFQSRYFRGLVFFVVVCGMGCACSVAEPKTSANANAVAANSAATAKAAAEVPKGATIPAGPARLLEVWVGGPPGPPPAGSI